MGLIFYTKVHLSGMPGFTPFHQKGWWPEIVQITVYCVLQLCVHLCNKWPIFRLSRSGKNIWPEIYRVFGIFENCAAVWMPTRSIWYQNIFLIVYLYRTVTSNRCTVLWNRNRRDFKQWIRKTIFQQSKYFNSTLRHSLFACNLQVRSE